MQRLIAKLIICICSLSTFNAWAVSSVSITAAEVNTEPVEHQPIQLKQLGVLLDLTGKETLVIQAKTAQLPQGKAKNLQAQVNLVANQAINVQIEHIQYQQFEAKNTMLQYPMQAQMAATLSTEIKKLSEPAWAQARLSCMPPKTPQLDTWDCANGLYQAKHVNIPFSLNISPLHNGAVAEISFKEVSFSDEAGLHAAEKLSGNVKLSVQKEAQQYRWQNTLQWSNGEMFWQPFYLNGNGHQWAAAGTIDDEKLTIDSAKLSIQQVGDLTLSGQLRLKDWQITQLEANLPDLNLASAYPLVFKPMLDKTAFNHADIEGKASLNVSMREGQLRSFKLRLSDVNIDDQNKKFAFYRINADIPWDYDDIKTVTFSYQNGQLLGLPLGKTQISAIVNRYALTAPSIQLPILDGELKLNDISAAYIGQEWFWHLQAELTPVSMADVSRALKLPVMQGKAAAHIPLVTYSSGQLTTDGELTLNIFDGVANVTNLTMKNPLGVAPQLNADIALRNLELGALTSTFSFGAIQGKLDGDIEELELQNWKAVKFNASVYSSPGNYPKKISQRAVENISALGGAGAAAAIQRSFLQFFKQFNYQKMGLSCKLRHDVCEMHGIESTPQGYVIVKGSGIPSITVMGYNQTVGWGELLARIKRVTEGNSKAVIQ